ncbi:aldehyde dehydrogenase family protein [Pseudomonas sp. 02C 26]|uniref:aldehyde dehydrogenase family protein n=1 Tax=Pseudomonas sp. 02C 26 TaxID=2054914 RepID=UPI001C4682AE
MKTLEFSLSIDGRLVSPPETANAINPATEQIICEFPIATREHLEAAVCAAQTAFTFWGGGRWLSGSGLSAL